MQNLLSLFEVVNFLLPGFLLLVILELVIDYDLLLSIDKISIFAFVIYTGVAYIVGQVIDSCSQLFIQDKFVNDLLGHPAYYLMNQGKKNSIFLREYRSPLPTPIRGKVIQAAQKDHLNFQNNNHTLSKDSSPEFIEIVSHLLEKGLKKNLTLLLMKEFFMKYNFARNAGFATFIAFLMTAIASIIKASSPNLLFASTNLLASVVLFFRFLKFYRLYVYELLTVYATTSDERKVGFSFINDTGKMCPVIWGVWGDFLADDDSQGFDNVVDKFFGQDFSSCFPPTFVEIDGADLFGDD